MDKEDDGSTASGIMNDGSNPQLLGCALPFYQSNGVLVPSCYGSPMPLLPFKTTLVQITQIIVSPTGNTFGEQVTVPVIDDGPALKENRPIDLTPFTFTSLGGDLKQGLLPVMFRIIGGANLYSL